MPKPTRDDVPLRVHVVHILTDDRPMPMTDPATLMAWLPIIGPSAMVLAWRLGLDARMPEPVRAARVDPDTVVYDTAALAASFGIRTARLWQSFERLARFRLVSIDRGPTGLRDPADVVVFSHWPLPKGGES